MRRAEVAARRSTDHTDGTPARRGTQGRHGRRGRFGRLGALGRRGGLLVAMLGTVFVALLATASPAQAHAELVSSDPGDGSRLTNLPASVSVRFSEAVRLDVGYLRVVDGSGARVDTGTSEHPGGDQAAVSVGLRSGLGDGSYVVSYRVESADSHPIAGAYSFVVGDGPLASVDGAARSGAQVDRTVDVLFGLTRWASFAGLALLVGGATFLLLAWPAGRGERRPRRLVWIGWGVTAGTTALSLFLQSLYVSGQGLGQIFDTDLLDATLHTNYGRMLSVRLILLAALALLVDRVIDQVPDAAGRDSGERGWQVDAAGLLSLGVFATVAASGHAATGIQPPLAVLSDTVHLAAMSTWVGGIVVLVACLLPTRRTAELARALPVFSRVAVASVGALVVSGLYQTWREVGTLPALWSTDYGLLLIAKVATFLVLVAVGYLSHTAVRRRYVQPAVRALATPARAPLAVVTGGSVAEPAARPALGGAADPDEPLADRAGPTVVPSTDKGSGDAGVPDAGADSGKGSDQDGQSEWGGREQAVLSRLRRSVGIEAFIAIVVLALTAVLITQAPGRQTYTAPYDATLSLSGGAGTVQLQVTPAKRGQNDVHLYVFDKAGRPFAPRAVTLTATLPDRDIGPLQLPLHDAGSGHFLGSGLALPDSGRWTFAVEVRTSEFDQPTATTTVTVR